MTQPALKFIADDMLGRLAKWLRILGYDTLYLAGAPDEKVLRRAVEEGRILLTRDLALARRTPRGNGCFVEARKYLEQLAEIMDAFKLKVREKRLFALCLECNRPVIRVPKKNLHGQIPPRAFSTHRIFRQCPQCGKVYWQGTHYKNTVQTIRKLMRSKRTSIP